MQYFYGPAPALITSRWGIYCGAPYGSAHVNRGAQIELFDMDFIRLGVLVALHLMVDWMVDSKIV